MKKMFVITLAVCLYQMNSAQAATAPASVTPPGFVVPGECKNLALMQAQLISTSFHNNNMGDGTYNPTALTLKTNNGLKIGAIDYLGGDSEDQTGANAGKYPCDLDQNLCTTPGDAGGPADWARIHVTSTDKDAYDVAEVVVSMGGRGGCVIDSAQNSVR